MNRDEILSALHKAEDRLSKAKLRRMQAAHDGVSNRHLKKLDVAVDDALDLCKTFRISLRENGQ